jgi:hypothetical protein
VLVFRYMQRTEQFLAPAPRLLGAAVVAAGLIGLAFALRRRPRPRVQRSAPSPRVVGVVAFVAASLFFLKSESWAGIAFGLLVAGIMAAAVARWSRRPGFGDRHRLALAGGALLTYAWGGFLLSFLIGRTGPLHYLGNALYAAAAVALLTVATRRLRREQT